jgi:hypothetical protein
MCIEGAIFDKPFIDIVFDGWEKIPFHKSVASLYAPFFTYYQHIIKTDGVRLARSLDEIISLLNMYLKDPSIDVEGRKKIIKEQCFKLDRKSGERIGKFVLSQIK